MLQFSIRFVRAGCALFLALFITSIALAQQSAQPKQGADSKQAKAAINGTVTDPTQAVISGATVELSNAAGFKKETKTEE